MNRNFIFLKGSFCIFFVLFFTTNLFAKNKQKDELLIINKKADFIIDIATKISYPEALQNSNYKIGIYGRSREMKDLFEALTKKSKGKTIRGKKVELFHFKRTGKIIPIDLFFISGDSKIRLSNLNKKLEGRPYIILTENFPFGVSMLNFAINKDNELFFEIQEQTFKQKGLEVDKTLLESEMRVSEEKIWKKKLEAALVIIQEKEKSIEAKSQQIQKQTKVISYLSTAIIIAIFSVLIISSLVFGLFRLNKLRKQTLEELTDSINYAQYIQKAIVFKETLLRDNFLDYYIFYKPKNIVSGDFYWTALQKDRLFFAVADCTGHGVPGAMLSLICYNALEKVVKELKIYQPAKILKHTSEVLQDVFSGSKKSISDGMDLALCCLHLKENKLEYAGANSPLYFIENENLSIIKPDRQPVGKYEIKKPYTNHILNVKRGDIVYLFSDGYADQFGGNNDKKFSYSRLKDLFIAHHKEPMNEQKEILNYTFEKWKGKQEQVDDICVMGLRL